MNLFDPALHAPARHRATPVPRPGPDHVTVLMAVRNGAAYLGEQLASLSAQTHRDWSLVVGDDGSTDDSAEIVHRFAAAHPGHLVRLVPGPRAGFQRNFLSLLAKVPDHAGFIAFSDQDDVWRPEKLARAIAALGPAGSGPMLYGGRTQYTDRDLRPSGLSPVFSKPPDFANALVQSIAGGNTMVMNRAAGALLRKAAPFSHGIVSHDWWAYLLVSGAGGRVIYDPEPMVLYRQHGGNTVGAGAGTKARAARLRRLFRGDFKTYLDRNLDTLDALRGLLTPANETRLARLRAARTKGLFGRLAGLIRSGIYRQTPAGSAALWAAAVLRRL